MKFLLLSSALLLLTNKAGAEIRGHAGETAGDPEQPLS